jgi:hypothetical protein
MKKDRYADGEERYDDLRIERLERALVTAAYIVVRHGPQYAPYVERLKKELEVARARDPVNEARRILEGRLRSVGEAPVKKLCRPGRKAPGSR